MADTYIPRLKAHFIESIHPAMVKEFNYSNINQVPKLDKVVLNMGLGKATSDAKIIKVAQEQLQLISGQKPVVTKAKKSVATFKVREGMPLGVKVTLRRNRMYEFLDRLVTIALPRVRDFRGLSGKSFDGRGNYAFGIVEHIIFPEVNFDNIDAVLGMDVVVCTTASTNEEAKFLLKQFNFPFNN